MKLILFLFLLYLSIFQVLAQSNINAVITDKDNVPLEFVNISVNQTIRGTYTNKNGEFSINDLFTNDTLKFSSLGYKNKNISINNIKDTIRLDEHIINLKEVIVKSEYQSKIIGINKYRIEKNGIGDFNGYVVGTIIKKIPYSFLESVEIYILQSQNNPKNKFLLRIFNIDTVSGYPKADLLNERVFIPVSKNGWINIDLSKYKIKVESAVFLAVESMPNEEYVEKNVIVKDVDYAMEDVVLIGIAKTKNKDPLFHCMGRNDVYWQIINVQELFDNKCSFIPMIRGNLKY